MSGKVSHDDDHLDFGKVEKEVQSAVITEERYWRENDAKIRAVEQRVPTYDDFRDIVLASHLKPLEKGDKISDMGTFTQVWNQLANHPKATSDAGGQESANQTPTTKITVPKSGQEFLQAWRRLPKTSEDRKLYLMSLGPHNLSILFKTEISGGALGEFLTCLQTFDESSETDAVVALLECFSKSQRFSLSLAFLSKSEKADGLSVFTKLKSASETQASGESLNRIESLEKLYQLG